jgi:hypothetical protein
MKNHATLLSDFRKVTRNPNVSASDFDFFINSKLPTFLRQLSRWDLINSHYQYIPKLIITLTQNQWQYSWLDIAKYSSAAETATSGVITLSTVQSVYFIAAGDLATFDTSDYTIQRTTDDEIDLSSIVAATGTLYVYARPLFFTDSYLLKDGTTTGISEIPVHRSLEMLSPYKDPKYMYRVKGDKVEIGFGTRTGDKLHLFYVPTPLTFDNTNATLTDLTNPTQLTDEANNALVWLCGKSYFMQKGMPDDASYCDAMANEILGIAGISKGQTGF